MKLPVDFKEKYTKLLGEEASAFFESLDDEVQKGFRINPLKQNYQEVDVSLQEPVAYVKTGYVGAVSGKTLEHQAGYVYSQDLSAMYVGEVVAARPGEKILDLCAAPGGKSTHIAESMANEGLLVANEISKKRALILAENIERTGAKNVIVVNEEPQTLAKELPEYFDKVVVDAPCSGEGMFRKDPHAISYWHKDYPAQCAVRQKEILVEALKMLGVGGELIYSTCTFAPEEDEQIIAWLLENYPYLKIVPLKHYAGMDQGVPAFGNGAEELTGTVRLMPHHFKGEGHFIAKLKDMRPKKSTELKKKKKRKQKGTLTKEQEQLWQDFAQKFFKETPFSLDQLRCYGEYLYFYAPSWPDISRLRFMRPGLLLGVFKKKRFEPSYTLALSLRQDEVKNVLAVTKKQWQDYVAGNTVQLDKKDLKNGWYLLVCEGKPFAFGKLVDKTVKNFFPKGLRFYN